MVRQATKMHLMRLSEKLLHLSSFFHLKQAEIAKELAINQTTVGRWMAGESRPYDRHAIKLAQMFGITLEELLDDEKELPSRLTDDSSSFFKIAADRAKALFPNDPKAGQEAFEARVNYGSWRRTSLETAKPLRQQAAELLTLAESLEGPFRETIAPMPPESPSPAGPAAKKTAKPRTKLVVADGLPTKDER